MKNKNTGAEHSEHSEHSACNAVVMPNCEGVWWTTQAELPPIVVLQIYGELKWRQIGCDTAWANISELKWSRWQSASIPFFDKHGIKA